MIPSFRPGVDYLLSLAGIVGYVAVMQLLVWRGRPSERVHPWIAAWCLGALAFILGRWIQLGAVEEATAVFGSHVQLASAAALAGITVGSVRAAGAAVRWPGAVPAWLAMGGVVAVLALATQVFVLPTCDPRVDLLGRRYFEPRPTAWHPVAMAYLGLAGSYAVWLVRRSNLTAGPERRRALGLLAVFLAPLVVNEILQAARIVNTVGTLEFGFTAGAVVMDHAVTARYHREQLRLRTRFVEEVLAAQDEERRRIARELHDEAGQSLTSILVGLRELEETRQHDSAQPKIEALQRVAQSTLDDLGRLARGLHPHLLEDLGFGAAVRRYASELSELHGLAIDVEVVDHAPTQLPKSAASALYRVVQEALTNAIRHAQARNVSLVVHRDPISVRLTVEDDGRGFDPATLPSASGTGGFGLRAIRERLALLGGSLEIDSTPGVGTTLVAEVPLGARLGDG